MKFLFTSALCLICLLPQSAKSEEPTRAKVFLLGTFHFANPGHDVVKTDVINVMSDDSQAYLVQLSQRIADLKPTAVLLEYDPLKDAEMQSRYTDYLAGDFELTENEIYQLGFRIASLAGLKSVQSFDEREIGWDAKQLFERIESDPATQSKMDQMIAQVTEETNQKQSTLSLGELLKTYNTDSEDRLNRSFYVVTNHLGAEDDFVGADATASWWHRNFRMYARIQHHAPPGSRVVVIGGQGHTAILRGLLEDDPDRDAIDVMDVL